MGILTFVCVCGFVVRVFTPSPILTSLVLQCLAIVQPYKIEDATMFLLERTGDVTGAMEAVLR